MRIKWLAFAALFVVGSVQTCYATVIFVTLTHDAIYVGADGRATNVDAIGNEIGVSDVCKIRRFGNIIVADSGIMTDPWTGLDIWSFFATVKATSVADFSNQIKTQLPQKYEAAYAELKKRNGRDTKIAVPGDIGVMAFEDGKPAFIRIVFFVQDGTVKAAIKDDGREFDVAGKGIGAETVPIGEANAISLSDFGSLDCDDGDPVNNTRCLLAAYIKADPKHINQPIAILKLTSTTSEWIEPGACKNQ